MVLTDSKNSTKSGRFQEILGSYDPRNEKNTQLEGARIKELITTKELEDINTKISEVQKNVIGLNKEYNKIISPEYTKELVKQKEIADQKKAKEEAKIEKVVEETKPEPTFKELEDAIEDRRGEELMKVPANDVEQQKAVNDRYNIEIEELKAQYEDKTVVNEDPEIINTQTKVTGGSKDRNAKTINKTESSWDNQNKPARNRFYRYVENSDLSGHKLLVVTKNNNLKLYNELLDLDEDAKSYEKEYKKDNKGLEYQGIYTVIVDKNNNIIKANEKGELNGKDSEIVFSTLVTQGKIERGEVDVENVKEAIATINARRDAYLASKKDIYLNIIDKSKGIVVYEATVNGVRQSHSVIGRLADTIDDLTIQLPTIKIAGKTDRVELKNGQIGQAGKLYAFTSTDKAIDLIPRTLTDSEVEVITDLINQKLGVIENQTGKAGDEIEKLIYFGIPASGVKPYTIGVAKNTNILTLGEQTLTKEQLSTPEGQNTLKTFLKTKRVNVNKKYGYEDRFVDAGGKTHTSYKEYLLGGENPMFGTDIRPKTEIQFIQQYLIYDPKINTDEIKVFKEVTKPVEVQTEEQKKAELEAILATIKNEGDIIDFGDLNKLASKAKTTVPLSKEEITWFKTTFPNIPIEKVKGLIDNKAFGRFLSAGEVLLSSEAVVGTLRHEAFHTVTQLYLTQEELDMLYKETKSRIDGIQTDLETEEALADDFEHYKTTKNILSKASQRNTLFRKIFNFLKDLLNIKASSIEDIYRRLDKGFYTNKPIIGIRQFSRLDKALPNQSEINTKQILEGVDAIFFDILFKNGFTPSKIRETQKLSGAIFAKIKQKIGTDEKISIDTRLYILKNWEKVVEAWLLRGRSFGIELNTEEVVDLNEEEKDLTNEDNVVSNDNAYQEANLVSTKSVMHEQSKMLIRSLKEKNLDGTDKLNDLGLPSVVNFNTTYNFLLKQLASLSTYEEIYAKIEELSVSKPEFKDLLARLGQPSSANTVEQFLFQMQFRQDFSKNQNTSFITKLNLDGTVYLVDANKRNNSERIIDKWKGNLRYKATVTEEGTMKIDPKVAEAGNNFEFLNNIGFTLSTETQAYLEEEKPEFFSNAVRALRNKVIEKEGDVTNLFEPKEKSKEKSDEVSNIKRLADLEADYSSEATELSFLSTENKTVYSIGYNNALSIIKNIINNSKTKQELFARLPHLDTLSTEGSVWLDQLFDEKGNKRKDRKINVDLHDGVSTGEEVKGSNKFAKSTRKLSAGDKYVQEFASILMDGRSSYIRASDKSTEHTLSLNKFGKSQKLAIPVEDVKDGFTDGRIKDIFNAYFKAEFKRVALFKIKDLGKDIDVYNQHGGKWSIFESILRDTKKGINAAIEELKAQDLTTEELTAKLDEIAPSFYADVNADVNHFFDVYTTETLNDLTEYNINIGQGISTEYTGKYSLEQLTRAVVVNDFINSVEQTKLFIGDMSFYKDLFKRSSAFTGTKQTADSSQATNDWLNNHNKRIDKKTEDGKISVVVFDDVNQELNKSYLDEYIDALVSAGITKEQAKVILKAYKSMDEGDAQGWITLDELRSFEYRMGSWTPYKESLFDKIQSGKTLSAEELVYFTVKKAQYAGPQEYKTLFAPAYHKYSLLPLIPQLVAGRNLEKVLNQMTADKVGYALFKSGSKVGTKVNNKKEANQFYTDGNSGEINTNEWQKQTVYYDFLGLQTETSEPHAEVIFGTQFRKLLFSNMFNGGTETFTGNKKLLEEYDKLIDDLVQAEKTKLIKDLGIDPTSYKSTDVTKLVTLLQDEAKARNLADNIIDSLIVDGNLMLKYKFDAMVNKAKIDSMITSLVTSRLIRQKFNGDALIQVASSGMEETGERKVGINDTLAFYRKDTKTGKTLPAEVMVAMNDNYRHLLDKYETVDKLNKAIANGDLKAEELEFIAYRIPTQGFNSMDYFTIKEFLPEESSTSIVLPTAIVAKSGGDYDVDKLNVLRPTFKEGKYASNKENRIIEIAKEILSHEENFAGLITPNSSALLKSVADEIRYIEFKNKNPKSEQTLDNYTKDFERNLKDNIRYTNQLKLSTKIKRFIEFLTAKDMIGIAAIQNTHHILAQQNDLTLNTTYKDAKGKEQTVKINLDHNLTSDKKINIASIKDVLGNNNISEVISQILTAAVDAAKDPFVFKINMTLETLSTYLYLVRIGVPFETAAYFMSQPIITTYLKELSINNSGFLKAVGKSDFPKVVANRVLGNYQRAINKKTADLVIKTLSLEELKSYLNTANQNTQEYYETQVQVLNDFLAYKQQANLLVDAIRATNQDTAGLGKDLDTINRKIESIQAVKNVGFVNGVDTILEKSLVKSFNQLEFAKQAFSQFYYTQNPEFRSIKDKLFKLLQPFGDKNQAKISTLIENDLISFVIENWGYSNISDLKNKLFKTDSVAKKLLAGKLKSDATKTAQEKVIYGTKDKPGNLLIRELHSLLRNNKKDIDNLKLYAKRYDTFTANQLTTSFVELKELDPSLAKEIMDLGILQSGLNNSSITYLGIIPYEYYNDLVKTAFEKFAEDKKNGVELEKFIQLFLQNNAAEPTVAKVFDKVPLARLGDGQFGKDYKLPETIVTVEPTKSTEPQAEEDLFGDESYIPDGFEEGETEDETPSLASAEEVKAYSLPDNGWVYEKYNLLNKDGKIKTFSNNAKGKEWLETLEKSPYLDFKLRSTTGGLKILIFPKENIFASEESKLVDTNLREKYFKDSSSTTSLEILKKIAESNHPLASLAKQLTKYAEVNNIPVYLDDVVNFTGKEHGIADGIKANAYFNGAKKLIRIAEKGKYPKGSSETVLLHEIIHSLTSYELARGSKFTDDFEALYEYAKTKLDSTQYALSNVDEFMTAIFTNAAFAKQLINIEPLKGAKEHRNLFEQIFDYILSLFGITKDNSLYHQAFAIATNIIDNQDENSEVQQNRMKDLAENEVVSLASEEEKKEPEKIKVEQENPFKEQLIFFDRQVKALKKQQEEFNEGTPSYNKLQEQIFAINSKLVGEVTEEAVKNLGIEALTKAEEYIKRLEANESEDQVLQDKNIRFNKDIIDTFLEFDELATDALKLRKRLYPFINKIVLRAINNHKTETFEITQEMIDAQNEDIGTFTKGTGSLSDQSNYIARTVGLIIKEAQNRVSTFRKQTQNSIQAEIDALGEWGKKNGVSLDKIYDMFIQEHKGTLVLAKPFNEDGSENKNYEKIQNTPELERFYRFYQTTIDKANEGLPLKVSRNFIPNIHRKDVKSTFRNLIDVKSSLEGDFVGNEDLYADIVHQKFLSKLESSAKSRNLGDSLLTFAAHSFKYNEMSEVLPEVRLLEEGLKYKINSQGAVIDREYIKSSDPSRQVTGEDSNLAKMTSAVIDMQVKGQMKIAQGKINTGDILDEEGKVIGEKYIHASNIADVALKFNSMLRIGFSPVTAGANILFGDVSNIIEAVGGRFFTLGGLHSATKIFTTQTFDKESDMNKWLEKLNPLQELDDYDSVSDKALKGKMSVEKFQEYMYSMQKQGEKYLQSRTMIAVLIKEGYMTSDGKTTVKGEKLTEKELAQLSDKVQRLNQMIHGRYSQNEAATWHQNVAYRLASQFRKWIPAAVESRLGEKKYDVRLGVEIEGRYRTFADLIFSKNVMTNLNKMIKGELSELEMYNMKKMLVELTLWAGATLLFAGLHGGDDEDKKFRKNPYVKVGLSLLNRVSGDIEFFYSPNQITNLTKNAIPLGKTAGDLLSAIESVPKALISGEYKYKRGSRKNNLIIPDKFGRLVPGIKPILDVARLANDQLLEELE